MTNTAINLPANIIAFLQVILGARIEANALDTPFAYQTGTYGALDKALTLALAEAIDHYTLIDFGTCTRIALLLNQETINNGEDIAYQIDLWNRNLISL